MIRRHPALYTKDQVAALVRVGMIKPAKASFSRSTPRSLPRWRQCLPPDAFNGRSGHEALAGAVGLGIVPSRGLEPQNLDHDSAVIDHAYELRLFIINFRSSDSSLRAQVFLMILVEGDPQRSACRLVGCRLTRRELPAPGGDGRVEIVRTAGPGVGGGTVALADSAVTVLVRCHAVSAVAGDTVFGGKPRSGAAAIAGRYVGA